MKCFGILVRLALLAVVLSPLCSYAQPVGARMSNPILMGTYSGGTFSYSSNLSNATANGYLNDYGQPSDDIYYKFTVQGSTQISISTCGSAFDTYLHLLNSSGTLIVLNDDYGPICATTRASISTTISAGTYFIVAEGWSSNSGLIATTVNLTVQAPVVSDTRNFIKTWVANAPQTDANALMNGTLKEVKLSTTYFDGLGRPEQTVAKKGSLSSIGNTDLVTPVVYDVFGREAQQYLPYVSPSGDGLYKANVLTEQNTFYTGTSSPIAGQGETFFYAKTEFEPSPLNRSVKTYAPGNSWIGAGRGVGSKYLTNTDIDAVRIWNVNVGVIGSFSTYVSPAAYTAGQLYKNITVDEHGKQVIEFKDKEGKVILKKVQLTATADDGVTGSGHSGWLCTYYLYDDLNNLRCVVQPRGVELISNTWFLAFPPYVHEQCFRYEYDQRNRMIVKKLPGALAVYMIYDQRDRLVMTQDANLRAAQQWLVTVYENGLNRPVYSYKITDPVNYNNPGYHRDLAYNSSSYPVVGSYTNELLTETHYDDYTNLPAGLFNTLNNSGYGTYLSASSSSPEYAEPVTQSTAVKGMVTWVRTKVLGTANQYISMVNIYDSKGRVIQVQTINSVNGLDVTTIQYSFSGQILRSHTKHQKPGINPQSYDIATKNNFDDLGRVSSTEKNLNNSGWKMISSLTYDGLGQLKSKKLAPAYNGNAGLQTLTYDYNIRGWLLGMNRSSLTANGISSTFFGFELGYDKLTNSSARNYQAGQWNGNISGMVWKSNGDGIRRKYDFTYDAANRLMQGLFEQNDVSATWGKTNVDYTVKMGDGTIPTSAYDANGNIKQMQQWGLKVAAPVQIDNLTYTYSSSNYSNKLQQVTDLSNDNTSKLGDFKYNPATKTIIDYNYDGNGNLISDANKAITSITYNHLNLPSVITIAGKGTITYTYDASGNKLGKTTVENNVSVTYNNQTANNTVTTSTDYVGGFVYESKTYSVATGMNYANKLQFGGHEEGRIRAMYDNAAQPSALTGFAFDYMIKDHLGNVRMVLTDEVKTDIYPAATLENNNTPTTDPLSVEKKYYTINTANIVSKSTATGITAYQNHNGNPPTGNSSPIPPNNNPNCTSTTPIKITDLSDKLYKINGNDAKKTGLDITLKVMSGDKINILGKSYYFTNTATPTSPNLPLNDIINAMLGTPTGTTIGKATADDLVANTSGFGTAVNSFITKDNTSTPPGRPRAFINYILFDEQFNYVTAYASQVNAVGGTVKSHWDTDPQLQNIPVTKNGYIYVYCSNESPVNVFFDNLQVSHTRGAVLEETHYYPFGLTMAGISSKAAGSLENKRKWNKGSELESKEFSDGSGLELYSTFYRSLDPQIGRWWQIDPKPDYAQSLYSAMGNNPILHNDPLGDTLVYPGASNKFIQTSATTISNILNSGAGKALGELLTSTENIKVVELKGKGISNYNPKTKTLSWNPKLGIVTTNGTKLSSASVLNHEADHAADAIKDPTGHATRTGTPDANYGNAEEKRVIQGTEQTTSFLLGETQQGQVTRTDHSASALLITNDPMSTNGTVINLSSTSTTLPPVIIKSKPKANHEYE